MNKKIYIFGCYENKTQISYVIYDQNNLLEKSVVNGSLADIQASKQDQIILIISQRHVLLTSVNLPKLTYQRLMQAVPFTLEENLIDDIHTLHFAVGAFENDHWPIAVIAVKEMDYWYQTLLQLGLAPSLMIPAALALPFSEGEWSIAIFHNEAIVRLGKWDGFFCELENLPILLNLKINEVITKPIAIHVHAYTDNKVNLTLENIPIKTQQLPPNQFTIDLANQIDKVNTINLFQGNYQPKTQISQVRKSWFIASMLLGAALLLAFLGNLISLFILQHHSNQLHSAIKNIYQQTFPNDSAMIDPQEKMLAELKKLTSQTNRNLFLSWLGFVSQTFSKVPGIHLQTIDFRNQQMSLQLTTATFNTLEKFIHELNHLGIKAKQQNASTAGTQVKATVVIQK